MFINMLILVLNVLFSFGVIKMISISITRLHRKPCMWLIFHLVINDLVFTVIAQSVYAAKLLVPNLKCSFDLVAMFITQSLSNTSIALIVVISFLRYMSTKHLLSMQIILTLPRAKYMLAGAFTYGVCFSSVLLFGSIIDNAILINLPPCLTDIIVPVIIPIIYNRALLVTRSRRTTVYAKGRISFAEDILRQVTVYTLATYLPFRLCFFVTSTFKMIYTVELDNNSTYLLQFLHSVSYLILCMTPIGNSILYILSDRRARRTVIEWKRELKRKLSNIQNFKLRRPSVANMV